MYHLNALDRVMQWDRQLFALINDRGSASFLDMVLPFLRESQLWVPFYLFMILFMTINFKKMGWWWVLAFVLTAALADIISSHIIKENIMRMRPCRDPLLSAEVIFRVNYCPKSSSFTSSHATSHFALSMFIWRTLRRVSKWWGMIFLWAFAICYTQVYVGVHYPLDVICGGLLGCGIGAFMAYMYARQIGLIIFDKTTLRS
ncbi:MAG TPA: phosphatase PAP2 family protein [Chitinophagaceae bacterium]|nr:phosphatase PAP2 family protein [Chitinophagaceae bacterium]